MAALVNYNYSTNYAEFSIENEAELAKLPTTTAKGSGELANIDTVKAGSMAYTTSGIFRVFRLDGAGNWNEITFEDGGGESWITDSSEMHRNIFRGKYLGTAVTAAQKAAIADGSFNDLFLGDYWTINGVNWRIADMDYYYEKFYAAEAGELQTTDKHHLVIVSDTALYETFYKDGNTDTTGYAGSALHSAEAAEAIVNSAFPGMMLTYNDLLMTTSQPRFVSAIRECTVEAMSSAMVFGNYTVYNTTFTSSSSLNDLAAVPSCRQFALFGIAPVYIQTENHYFLRDSCDSNIKVVVAYSSPRYYPPNQKAYHRPFFLLGSAE